MKRCPVCQRVYDDTMAFCLEDGSALGADSAGGDMAATVIMPDPRVTAPPPAWPETVRQPQQQPPPPLPYMQPQPAWQPPAAPHTYQPAPARQGRGAAVTSLVLAISSFALLGFCVLSGAAGVNSDVIGGIFLFSVPLALAGAILGIVAMSKTSRDPSPQNSKAMAVIALVLNAIYLLVTVVILVLASNK
jgi:hypothetical protein